MNVFGQHVAGVVTEFLETALVVDDEGWPSEAREQESSETEAERAPPRARGDLTLEAPSDADLQAVAQFHPLSTKALIDAFADVGVVCSVLAPLEGDEIRQRVLKTAARSDLLVLDWELHRDAGQTARQLIKSVLAQDAHGDRKRLRVIAIYTGDVGLKRIMEDIRADLDLPATASVDEGMTLAQDNFRITAFSKPIEGRLRPELAARRVREEDLPGRLVTEFANLTHGLVPAVALAGLAAIRSDTHRVLQALRENMDLGYLGHRVASSFPEDAEGHLVDILSSEIASVLNDSDVGAYADIAVIRDWLERARGLPDGLRSGSALSSPKEITEEQLDKMLTIGLGLDEEFDQHTAEGLSKGDLRKVRREAARLFTNDPVLAERSASIFGMRMAVRTLYSRPRRVLQLGTMVLRGNDFLVCLQPRCDSVRMDIGVPRVFPFLPLTVSEAEGGQHEFVVEHPRTAELFRLRLETKPSALKMFAFLCGDTRSVEARQVRGTWAFYTTSNHRFVWVAALKPEFAQRVAVDLAAEIARVGLSESELVRLSGG